MKNYLNKSQMQIKRFIRGQRGITGLETAIVLIAFVVVSSVFAFAALSTGLFSADKSKETIQSGLSTARGSLEMRGSVIAEDTDGNGQIDKVSIQVANAAGGENIDLTQGQTVIRYSDADQAIMFDTSAKFSVTPMGNGNSNTLLEPGELYELTLLNMQTNLTTPLIKSKTFTLEVMTPKGAVLHVERTIPVGVDKYNDLG